MIEESSGISVRLKLFREWLRRVGSQLLITSFADQEYAREVAEHMNRIQVNSADIVTLCKGWGAYQGRTIGEDTVRQWLDQFRPGDERRSMFTLLKGVTFFTADDIRQRLREGYNFILRNTPGLRLDQTRTKRSEFLVSYLGGPGKSGTRYARLFADENNLYAKSVSEFGSLAERLKDAPEQVLVFVDDFIGTGNSLRKGLRALEENCGKLLTERKMAVRVVIVAGFQDALSDIEKITENLPFDVRITISHPFGREGRCFSPEAPFWESDEQKLHAEELARTYGARLHPEAPLGHGGSQALVVFEENCPNNSLPILWSGRNGWLPLFER